MNRTLIWAGLAMLIQPSVLPAQQRVVAPTIEAGGQRCIAWTFVQDVKGVYDRSRVEFRNTCPAPVSFFYCKSDVYSRGMYPPCDAQRGSYIAVQAPAGWTTSSPSSARAQQVVVIRECPAGTRTDLSTGGRFYCRK